jgi:hypothetical protein
MGAIASSGAPSALDLFRDVLVASASVPGAYSPVLINVEGEGHRFEEMHVDGGVRANLLVVPESLLLSIVPPPSSGVRPRVYILMNNKLEQDFERVEGRTLAILARSFTPKHLQHCVGQIALKLRAVWTAHAIAVPTHSELDARAMEGAALRRRCR